MVSRVNIVGYDCGVEYDPDGYYVKYADYAALEARLAEMTRRRDEWRKKAEGYDEVRRALREKVGTPWPPHMSRLLWAGIAADEKKRADDAEAQLAEARKALGPDAYEVRCTDGNYEWRRPYHGELEVIMRTGRDRSGKPFEYRALYAAVSPLTTEPAAPEGRQEAVACIACEDKPAVPNDPCAVCGKTSRPAEQAVMEEWREIKQHVQPRIADGYTAVAISKPGYWFVKGPGPAAAAIRALGRKA